MVENAPYCMPGYGWILKNGGLSFWDIFLDLQGNNCTGEGLASVGIIHIPTD
jgi:hypothetical protein